MQRIDMYQVDAFTDKVFHGNPAAVCVLQEWLNDELLQAIATENNLSETAFVVLKDGAHQIRWFTPQGEVSLCGHATLAAAYVMFEKEHIQGEKICFSSLGGALFAEQQGSRITLNFPKIDFYPLENTAEVEGVIDIIPAERYESELDYLLVLDSVEQLQSVKVNHSLLIKLPKRGLILTAPSVEADFHSRAFYPKHNIPEDPVTGSAHCILTPYWSKRLNKHVLYGIQGGQRRGNLCCELKDDRVFMSGDCRWYMEGHLLI